MKRVAIYFFYDKDGIVDGYVDYFLEDLKKNLDRLIVVCNGKLTSEGRKKFSKYTSEIIVRENKGFDVWAYKEGIEYIGWDNLKNYDELIMLNMTIMGPIYPFKEMFDEMDSRKDLDFWGITKFHKFSVDPWGLIQYGYIPEHIQSHFIAVRKPMLESYEFKQHWEKMRMINTYFESVSYHESIFTKKFNDKGFKSDTYVNSNDLKDFTDHPIIDYPKKIIKEDKCPIFKRRSFFNSYDDFLTRGMGRSSLELFKYIEKNTNYDVNLIWDNILRVENMYDIKNTLHLNYNLPSDYSLLEDNKSQKIGLFFHIYFEDLIEECFHYVSNVPEYTDIFITTDEENKKIKIENKFSKLKNKVDVKVIENRGRDVSAFLVPNREEILKYDIACFAHDKKTKQLHPELKGEEFKYKCLENILGNKNFVNNIIDLFIKNPRLGLLSPPAPNHAEFYGNLGREWGENYDITIELLKDLNIKSNVDKSKAPIAPYGTMFWFRPKAMKKLLEKTWVYKDFPEEPNKIDGTILHAIERAYPFVVQEAGFYSANVLNEEFSRIEMTNLGFMLSSLNKTLYSNKLFQHYGMQYFLLDFMKKTLGGKLKFRNLLKMFIISKMPEGMRNFLIKVRNKFRRRKK
nr:rhamnan synthesis F family protein [uncultured Leptotrichia sp.]